MILDEQYKSIVLIGRMLFRTNKRVWITKRWSFEEGWLLNNMLGYVYCKFHKWKNNASVEIRQKNNDECFDFAVEKIEEFIKERMIKNGKHTNRR